MYVWEIGKVNGLREYIVIIGGRLRFIWGIWCYECKVRLYIVIVFFILVMFKLNMCRLGLSRYNRVREVKKV